MSGNIHRPVFGVGRADPDARARGAALRTPSPCFSDVSTTSSYGPPTPPPALRALPRTLTGAAPTVSIHDALSFRPDGRLPINYDVTKPHSSTSLALGTRRSLKMLLLEPATQPATSELVLMSDLFPWTIPVTLGTAAGASAPNAPRVRPVALPEVEDDGHYTPRRHTACIAVEDVLAALHREMQEPLTTTELASLPADRHAAIIAEHNMRVINIEDRRLREHERSTGPRRADALTAAGRTHFIGLGATKHGPNTWMVNFGPGDA